MEWSENLQNKVNFAKKRINFINTDKYVDNSSAPVLYLEGESERLFNCPRRS